MISRGLGRGQLPNCRQSNRSQRWFSVQDPAGLRCLTAAPSASIAAGSMLGGILPARATDLPRVCTQKAAQMPWEWAIPRGVPRESLTSPLARTDVTSCCHQHGIRG